MTDAIQNTLSNIPSNKKFHSVNADYYINPFAKYTNDRIKQNGFGTLLESKSADLLMELRSVPNNVVKNDLIKDTEEFKNVMSKIRDAHKKKNGGVL